MRVYVVNESAPCWVVVVVVVISVHELQTTLSSSIKLF